MQKRTRLADEKLVAAYASGNNEAFDTLLRRHENRVFNYIFNIVKNKDVADDIFQETFVKAISTIKQGRYTISTDQEDADVLNRRDLSEENVEDLMVTSQIHTDVKRIMESLPESQREVLDMRFYRNMSFKEIAEATGVSINTALGRMRYAILNMRRIASDKNIVLTR